VKIKQAVSPTNSRGAGFAENDIPVLLCDNTGYRRFAHKALKGAAVGGGSA